MSGILLFLFILFVAGLIRLLWPVLRLYMQFRKARRQAREYFGAQSHGYQQPGHKAYRPRRRKIIDPSVGEYVEFEEIACDVESSYTQSDSRSTSYEHEEQIVDVKWEDI